MKSSWLHAFALISLLLVNTAPITNGSKVVRGPNPLMLTDINNAISAGSDPYWLMAAGNHAYFFVQNAAGTWEFWRTDGSPDGTKLVKSGLMFGVSDFVYDKKAKPGTYVVFKDKFYFLAKETDGTGEMWETDGTSSGTRRVLRNGEPIYAPDHFVVINGLFFFMDYKSLYSYNGLPNGFTFIIETNTIFSEFFIFSNNIYFLAIDWDSVDHFRLGCIQVNPPAPVPSLDLLLADNKQMMVFNNQLFFSAREENPEDGSHGFELWKMGTTGEVSLVADLHSWDDSNPGSFWVSGNFLYFSANDSTGIKLWRTDGSEAGTNLVQDLSLAPVDELTYVNFGTTGSSQPPAEMSIFASLSKSGNSVWATNGTPGGTVNLNNAIDPNNISSLELGGRVFFISKDDAHGMEIWVTDGTPEGTHTFKDIWPGRRGSDPEILTKCGLKLCFFANNGSVGQEVWGSDGSETGTTVLFDFNTAAQGSDPWGFTQVGDQVFFLANDSVSTSNLWRTDGSPEGTIALNDDPNVTFSLLWAPDASLILPRIGSVVYLGGEDSEHGLELWRSDGTPDGTYMVKDINPGVEGTGFSNTVAAGNKIYFVAYEPVAEWDLWVTDGSENGTHLVKDVVSNNSDSAHLEPAAALGNSLVFFVGDYMDDFVNKLWVSDGTEIGTNPISRFQQVRYMTSASGKVFFAGERFSGEAEKIYVTDGTLAGTKPVSETVTFFSTVGLYGAGNRVFISEQPQYFSDKNQLFSFDITESGYGPIHQLFDQNNLIETIGPKCIGNNGRLGCAYLQLNATPVDFRNYHLWMSDGTTTGTRLITGAFVHPAQMFFKGTELVFTAEAAEGDRQIWVTDGTAQGVRQITNFPQKMCGDYSITYSDFQYFLPLNDGNAPGKHGCEPWAFRMPKPAAFLSTVFR
ncbi:MAG TPA: hypothetical protein PJ988_09150 [Anaerolinea sp.]|nr:hypothetical protein [Anaerolinea sp.]